MCQMAPSLPYFSALFRSKFAQNRHRRRAPNPVGAGFEQGAQRAVVRNPVVAERIAHATPNVKISEAILHAYLPVLTTQLV